MSRIVPVNIGGSASAMRFTASSTGNSSPSARMPGQLQPLAEDPALAGLQVAAQAVAMTLAQRRRDHQLGHLLADGRVLWIAEELLGGSG